MYVRDVCGGRAEKTDGMISAVPEEARVCACAQSLVDHFESCNDPCHAAEAIVCVCVCVCRKRLNTTPARPRHIRMRPLAVSPKDSSDTTKSPNQVCMSSAYESAVEDKDGIATADTSLEEGWDAAHEPGAGDER